MQTLWIGLFVVLILGLLVALLWWRFKGGGMDKKEKPVAVGNHPSIMQRHYGPAPAPPVAPPLVAAPPLAADSPLSQLMPEEDFRAQEEKDIQAEADRIEAEEAEQREAAEQASQQPALPEVPEAAEAPEEVPAAAPTLRSLRHAAGAVSVFDALGLDELAQVVDELPTAAAPDDDTVAEALFYNPFTAAAPSKNDKANSLTRAELRRRTREAIQAEAGGNKAALTTLLAENNPRR
jgi:hypothetical protein